MTTDEPQNMVEFAARYALNTRITGYGMNVMLHHPCPFCAAPEWVAHYLQQTEAVLNQPHYCATCKRSACVVFRSLGSATELELVQTEGPDVPSWFQPKPRRV